ncbi:hypothetical protein AVEN_93393-1 [Araneus ventricosus]|uniref:Uncharacterized protein n=1 Tax=Araneus ventricosus TaxID=182803 RepID=A0A4Y2AQW8_ARAVE|nr:hypothetical protein AVEN_93393-1 [Araneus ventricosus]
MDRANPGWHNAEMTETPTNDVIRVGMQLRGIPESEMELSPPCLNIRDDLIDSHRDVNTETVSGVLIAITSLGPRPVIGQELTQSHAIIVPTKEASTRLLIRRLLIQVLVVRL